MCELGFGWGPVLGPEDGAKAEKPGVEAQTPTHTTKYSLGTLGGLRHFLTINGGGRAMGRCGAGKKSPAWPTGVVRRDAQSHEPALHSSPVPAESRQTLTSV